MPIYEVIHDLAVPGTEPADHKRFRPRIIKGGQGNTIEMDEETAAPFVVLGILAVPGADEPARQLREKAAAARQRAEDALQTAAVAEDESSTIESRMREEAAYRLPEGRSI